MVDAPEWRREPGCDDTGPQASTWVWPASPDYGVTETIATVALPEVAQGVHRPIRARVGRGTAVPHDLIRWCGADSESSPGRLKRSSSLPAGAVAKIIAALR